MAVAYTTAVLASSRGTSVTTTTVCGLTEVIRSAIGPQFRDLLFRRGEPRFYAFDILWDEHAWSDNENERHRFRSGEDVRYLPLSDRKLRLRAVVPKRGERLLY